VPFRVLPVNMCTKSGVTPVGCAGNAAQKNFNDAVATSYFKMSKW
jgi:hypothetical protein